MRFIIVDDESMTLRDIAESIREAVPDCELHAFQEPESAVSSDDAIYADVAFLDIEMGKVNGIELAKQLKGLNPSMRIIFVTGHSKYAVDAFAIHATGYLMKPVMPDDVLRELTFIYDDIKPASKIKFQVRTFGGFSVSVDGKPLCFKRAKAKELLACLVDRRGVEITTREACALLWEDSPYDKIQKSYFQTIVAELRVALKSAGVEEALIKKRNSLSINPELIDCDSYRFMDGDPEAINSYSNNYMSCYSWAEFTAGFMYKKSKEYRDQ